MKSQDYFNFILSNVTENKGVVESVLKAMIFKHDYQFNLLRSALIGIVGTADEVELEQMSRIIFAADIEDKDRVVQLNAISAILETNERE